MKSAKHVPLTLLVIFVDGEGQATASKMDKEIGIGRHGPVSLADILRGRMNANEPR